MASNRFTKDEVDFIRENYKTMTYREIAERLDSSVSSIANKIRSLRLPHKRQKSIIDTTSTPSKHESSNLSMYSPRDLILELKRRGYVGRLKYVETVVHEIDVEKLN